MISRIFIPRDTSANSMGADEIALAIAAEVKRQKKDIQIVRNGSRGLYWLEPMVEVEVNGKRLAYGPVSKKDVASLFEAWINDSKHTLCQGPTDDIEFLKKQERLTFARVGIIDPLSLEDYKAYDGLKGLRKALNMSSSDIVQVVTDSGLRGRGGAAFPTGIKWKTVLDAEAPVKYIVCNADEGDSGTFSDRMIMESDPFVLIEGMIIAGVAVGSKQGYIYLRSEYPLAHDILNQAINIAYQNNLLGEDILGSGHQFDMEVRLGAGAYICGEETSLLESLEGKRGEIRFKPPLPAIKGLFGQPTIVNNVITLASIPIILDTGAEYYKDFGMGRSRGTLPLQLTGNIKHGGLVEKAFGISLHELLYDYGGGSASELPIRTVQAGGPLGAYLPEEHFNTRIDYETFVSIGAMLGHGGFVVFDKSVNMAQMARFAMEFCSIESCGKCTPCRIGSTRGVEVIDRIIAGTDRDLNFALLDDLCDTMLNASLCALGGLIPNPVISALKYFPEDFQIDQSTNV